MCKNLQCITDSRTRTVRGRSDPLTQSEPRVLPTAHRKEEQAVLTSSILPAYVSSNPPEEEEGNISLIQPPSYVQSAV